VVYVGLVTGITRQSGSYWADLRRSSPSTCRLDGGYQDPQPAHRNLANPLPEVTPVDVSNLVGARPTVTVR
jgi:hypothetical protein